MNDKPETDSPDDNDARRDIQDRLGKVEAQLRGVGRMLDGQRPAGEVLQQPASTRSAVKVVTKGGARAYPDGCAVAAVRSGDSAAAEVMLETPTKFVKD